MDNRMEATYRFDAETQNWSFRVPALGIVGGAKTRPEAEKLAAEAIDFTVKTDVPKEASVAGGRIRRGRRMAARTHHPRKRR